jgi:hypothetical protein
VTEPPPDETDDDVSRRWLSRLLVGLGIGIPVLIEGTTAFRLITSRLFGSGDGGGDEGGATGTATPTERSAVGVGDELLAATAPIETVRELCVRARRYLGVAPPLGFHPANQRRSPAGGCWRRMHGRRQ